MIASAARLHRPSATAEVGRPALVPPAIRPWTPPFGEGEEAVTWRIAARSRRGIVVLKSTEVLAFEAKNRLCFVHSTRGTFDIDSSLRDVEGSALGGAFLRVHRNWLASAAHVRELDLSEGACCLFLGPAGALEGRGLRVPISREAYTKVRRALLEGTVGLRRRLPHDALDAGLHEGQEEKPMAVNEPASRFSIHVEQVDGFEFVVRFDKEQFTPLRLDEPAPLGRDLAPNASRILAAAIGNCLSASLVFCLKKAKVPVAGVSADVDVEIVRNEARRLRVGKVDVTLRTKLPHDHPALKECLATFEDFCIVTESVRRGIDVAVRFEAAAR